MAMLNNQMVYRSMARFICFTLWLTIFWLAPRCGIAAGTDGFWHCTLGMVDRWCLPRVPCKIAMNTPLLNQLFWSGWFLCFFLNAVFYSRIIQPAWTPQNNLTNGWNWPLTKTCWNHRPETFPKTGCLDSPRENQSKKVLSFTWAHIHPWHLTASNTPTLNSLNPGKFGPGLHMTHRP